MEIQESHSKRLATRLSIIVSLLLLASFFTANNTLAGAKRGRPIPVKPTHTEISSNANISHIVVKFVDGAEVRPRLARGAMSLVSRTGMNLAPALNELTPHLNTGRVERLIKDIPISQLDNDRARREAKSGLKLADMAGYYAVKTSGPVEAMDLIDRLNALDVVELAYPAPEPEPAEYFGITTADYSGSQDYLDAAPGGVDAYYASSILGGDGSGIKVIDVEGGWRTTHEDLAANPPFAQIGGQIGALDWRNHGTAVIGEILGLDNGTGIRGIAPGVQWGYSSIGSQTTSGALLNAGSVLSPGDVVLIELHAPGPQFNFESREDQRGYVCMEFWQDNFDAILQLFVDGIVVCEAAGNGAENFDDALYGTIFDTTFRNSHAIICGAGAPPSGAYGADRSRLGFSNWGERVNLQGYGAGVVTLGYGDLFNGGTEDSWYTASFSGTSSASPIVTGSVAALQGAHKANFGFPLDADEIRTLLNSTGSPQVGSEHIGPRPNLLAAFDEALGVSLAVDTNFGSAPFTVQFTGASTKTVTNWLWDFGDGQSSTQQSPQHVYQTGGLYTVNLSIQSAEGNYSSTRPNLVAVVADTLRGLSGEAAAGQVVRLDVHANNSLPASQIKVPVEYTGPLELKLDSASVAGLRTSSMTLTLTSFNPFSKQATYSLNATGGAGSFLPSGSGPVVSLYFTIPPTAPNDVNIVTFDGYGVEFPLIATDWGALSPTTGAGQISLTCVMAGDADGSGVHNIADVTFLIANIFSGGPNPDPLGLGDADCDGSVNIADVTYLINTIFAGGPLPCQCAP